MARSQSLRSIAARALARWSTEGVAVARRAGAGSTVSTADAEPAATSRASSKRDFFMALSLRESASVDTAAASVNAFNPMRVARLGNQPKDHCKSFVTMTRIELPVRRY